MIKSSHVNLSHSTDEVYTSYSSTSYILTLSMPIGSPKMRVENFYPRAIESSLFIIVMS
jgi:hypothetical protein